MSEPSIKKALIIDDSVDYRQLIITFFKKACPDAKVEEYDPASGKPPDTFSWSEFDLLILDYDLGNGENGLEWLRRYKTSGDFPPTIMLTAQEDEELVVNAIRYGAQSFLRKTGLTKKILLDTINDALEKYNKEKEQSSSKKIQVHHYNKEKFFESLKHVKKQNAVLLVEINDFHKLHEALGIFSTDKFISYFTQIVSDCIKEANLATQMTRISDSTLALLVDYSGEIAVLEKLLESLCNRFDNAEYKTESESIKFFVNIGAAIVDADNPELSSLLPTVESACRKARLTSGNTYILDGGAAVVSGNDQEMLNEINMAIKGNNITPLYQSLVLVSGSGHKDYDEIYQIRVNIYDSEKNLLEPKKFFPLLEKTHSLKKLDRWIIRHCVSELAAFRKNEQKQKLGILIPISPQSINDKDLTDWINKLIEYVKIPDLGKGLIFEVHAHDFLGTSAQAKLQFNKLRVKLHATIALTNANSPDVLGKCLAQEKFNFILFSPEHAGKEKMTSDEIHAIVRKAQEHKAITIASRIDSGEYLALSASAGADYVLGHFVQPPMENIMATEEVEVSD